MQPVSAVAIYFLFWFLCLFFVLPFGVKTDQEKGIDPQPGNAESAPHEFRAGKIALRTTILSLIAFGLFYANYVNGWVGTDFLDFLMPENISQSR